MISSSAPSDWRELQREAGLILSQCGFTVEVEKKLRTVRGNVELDVYAEETVRGRKYSIACECKHWKSNVPQSVIHSFRTVVSDVGANIGYVISLKGFQSGSFDASELTNLKLVSWKEFQEAFCETWLVHYLSPRITKELDPILSFTEPLVPNWFLQVPDHDVAILRRLRDKYEAFGLLVMMFTPYSSFLRANGFPRLPLEKNLVRGSSSLEKIPHSITQAGGYREFLNEALAYGLHGIDEFRAVKKRNGL